MKPTRLLDRRLTPDGKELVLYERDGVYAIRVDGQELMSSRCHGSEEALARLTLAELDDGTSPRVLVGGLGMGYTLRAALDARPAVAAVVVAEVLPVVVAWNRGPLADLARSPLSDPRVTLEERDVADVIGSSRDAFDAVLLDIDNGPSALTLASNRRLYRPQGLAAVRRCLRGGGALGVWSADPEPDFSRALRHAGFQVRVESVFARGVPKGPKHTIFIGKRR